MEEIGTLPCIVGGVGEASGERAARLFEPLGAPIVQTTPVQAELAKIWTNILRYATFALPNLLMMDCERHGANVFDVIELINRDYPRGGMALPGLTAGTCLRKDFTFSEERSSAPGHAAGGLARARDRAAVPRRRRQAPARRVAARAPRRRARAELQGRHRRRARLALAQADPPARARTGRRRRSTTRSSRRRPRASRRPSPAPTSSSSPPTTARTRRRQALRTIAELAGPDCLIVDPWNALGTAPGVRLRRRGGGAAGMSHAGGRRSPRCR